MWRPVSSAADGTPICTEGPVSIRAEAWTPSDLVRRHHRIPKHARGTGCDELCVGATIGVSPLNDARDVRCTPGKSWLTNNAAAVCVGYVREFGRACRRRVKHPSCFLGCQPLLSVLGCIAPRVRCSQPRRRARPSRGNAGRRVRAALRGQGSPGRQRELAVLCSASPCSRWPHSDSRRRSCRPAQAPLQPPRPRHLSHRVQSARTSEVRGLRATASARLARLHPDLLRRLPGSDGRSGWMRFNGQPSGDPGAMFLPSHVSQYGGLLSPQHVP